MARIFLIILALAIVGYVAKLIIVAIVLAVLVALIWRPKQTLGVIVVLFILGMIGTYPWIALGTAALCAITAMIVRNDNAKREPVDRGADQATYELTKEERPVERTD